MKKEQKKFYTIPKFAKKHGVSEYSLRKALKKNPRYTTRIGSRDMILDFVWTFPKKEQEPE